MGAASSSPSSTPSGGTGRSPAFCAAEVQANPNEPSTTWRAYQGNDLVDHVRLSELVERTWELDRYEADTWTLQELDAINELRRRSNPALSAEVAHRLWRGVPDSFKGLVWTAVACGEMSSEDPADVEARYARALDAAFGDRVPERFERYPSFDDDDAEPRDDSNDFDSEGQADALARRAHFIHILRPEGVAAAQRLLWCCSQLWHSQLEFCPVLPVLCALLLIFCESEAAAYFVLSSVISRAAEDWHRRDRAKAWDEVSTFPVLPLARRHWAEVAARTARLAERCMPEACNRLRELGIDLDDVTQRALCDGLASQLPFRAVCRAYGAFLAEGTEVFVRLLLVLWRRRSAAIAAVPHRAAALSLLLPSIEESLVSEAARASATQRRQRRSRILSAVGCGEFSPLSRDTAPMAAAADPLTVDDMVRSALELYVPKAAAAWRIDSGGGRADIEDVRVFCRPRLYGDSSRIVWDELWPYLWQWLPRRCRVRDPLLRFAAVTDGYSSGTLLAQCEKVPEETPMLLVAHVCTKDGTEGVIGAFFPAAMRTTGYKYFDLGRYDQLGVFAADAFVFRVIGCASAHDRPQVWRWSGQNDMLLHAPACDSVALQVVGDSATNLCVGGGDGVALSLSADLRLGSTSACASFGSPPLLPLAEEGSYAVPAAARVARQAPTAAVGAISAADAAESVEYVTLNVEAFEID